MGNSIAELLKLAEAYTHQLPPAAPAPLPEADELAGFIDHTLLRPEATPGQVEQLCREAREFSFATVCVNSIYVSKAARLLAGSPVETCAVVGFPLGAIPSQIKAYETRYCLAEGAKEIDTVLALGYLKSGEAQAVLDDIHAVVEAAHSGGARVKVILETSLLTRAEKILACLLSEAAGADYVKTSTGFGAGGATTSDVDLMRRVVGPTMGVKASGGIRDLATAQAMIAAGASRLGTSSGAKILQEALGKERQPTR